MKNISLKDAIAIFEKHKIDGADISTNNYTPTQSCAALIVDYAKNLREQGVFITERFGARILDTTIHGKTLYQVRKDNSIFVFEEIPKVVLGVLGCKFGNCHQNCINVCGNDFHSDAIVHISEVGILPEEQTGIPGVLHSYLEYEDQVYDFSYGIIMNKKAYETLFNVKEIATTKVGKIQSDLKDGTLQELSNQNVCAEVYLMARDDCAKLVSEGK